MRRKKKFPGGEFDLKWLSRKLGIEDIASIALFKAAQQSPSIGFTQDRARVLADEISDKINSSSHGFEARAKFCEEDMQRNMDTVAKILKAGKKGIKRGRIHAPFSPISFLWAAGLVEIDTRGWRMEKAVIRRTKKLKGLTKGLIKKGEVLDYEKANRAVVEALIENLYEEPGQDSLCEFDL